MLETNVRLIYDIETVILTVGDRHCDGRQEVLT